MYVHFLGMRIYQNKSQVKGECSVSWKKYSGTIRILGNSAKILKNSWFQVYSKKNKRKHASQFIYKAIIALIPMLDKKNIKK